MSLSALPTARNIPPKLVVENIKHLNAFVVQGDKMFLNVIILDSGVQFLSAENLPTVVNIACCTNMLNGFSQEICRTRTSIQAKTTASHR